jgi:hypothetical protein
LLTKASSKKHRQKYNQTANAKYPDSCTNVWLIKYRLLQKSGHTGHRRKQSCIDVEGGQFDTYSKRVCMYILVKIFVKADMKSK